MLVRMKRAKIKKTITSTPSSDPVTNPAPTPTPTPTPTPGGKSPVNGSRRLVVMAVMIHLALVFVSLIAGVAPSTLVSSINAASSPYLRATHFGVDDTPAYITHGLPNEQPLWLVGASSASVDPDPLLPKFMGGGGADDRQQRWLGAVALLALNDQSSLIAEWLTPVLQGIVASGDSNPSGDPGITLVRVIREPTLISSAETDDAPPPYAARIVGVDPITLVQSREDRLTATARP